MANNHGPIQCPYCIRSFADKNGGFSHVYVKHPDRKNPFKQIEEPYLADHMVEQIESNR